jgi:biotin carboxyl carrier protein
MKTENNQDTSGAPVEEKELVDFVVEFRKYKTTLNRMFLQRRKWQPVDQSKIKSFIPGVITRIFVSEGDHVEAGQEMMVLEAMKMNNIVRSEIAGVIKKIHAAEMDKVPKNMVIFELEPDTH